MPKPKSGGEGTGIYIVGKAYILFYLWKYGRTIIDALFKRRTERIPICAELESRCEADRDRCNIRVFEVGLSPEQYGDYQQGTGNAAQEAEGARLIAIAPQYLIPPSASPYSHFRGTSFLFSQYYCG